MKKIMQVGTNCNKYQFHLKILEWQSHFTLFLMETEMKDDYVMRFKFLFHNICTYILNKKNTSGRLPTFNCIKSQTH